MYAEFSFKLKKCIKFILLRKNKALLFYTCVLNPYVYWLILMRADMLSAHVSQISCCLMRDKTGSETASEGSETFQGFPNLFKYLILELDHNY